MALSRDDKKLYSAVHAFLQAEGLPKSAAQFASDHPEAAQPPDAPVTHASLIKMLDAWQSRSAGRSRVTRSGKRAADAEAEASGGKRFMRVDPSAVEVPEALADNSWGGLRAKGHVYADKAQVRLQRMRGRADLRGPRDPRSARMPRRHHARGLPEHPARLASQERLGPVKGKNFRKEMTKAKRGTYRGGAIDSGAVNSVKF